MSEEMKPDVERLDDNTLLWTPGVWANSVKPGQDLSLAAMEAAKSALTTRTAIVDNNHFDRITVTGGKGESVEYEPVDRWIRVEERLPPDTSYVLIYTQGFGVEIGCMDKTGWTLQSPGGDDEAVPLPDYWQPLPPPPVDKSAPL